jgi:hypothetical protein
MEKSTKEILKTFSFKCRQYLNFICIPTKIGKYKIELSSRTISDVIEKHTIDYMIDYFGKDKVRFKNWRGYDVVLSMPVETIYLNIKTQEHIARLDATWLFSASIVKELEKQKVLEYLYCIKFEYKKFNLDFLEFLSGKVAGPISEVELIYYRKGDRPPCRLRTEFNGIHCHLLNEYYE